MAIGQHRGDGEDDYTVAAIQRRLEEEAKAAQATSDDTGPIYITET